MNVGKVKARGISRETSIVAPSTDYDRPKITGERGLLQLFG
jgi:hypothetical protein